MLRNLKYFLDMIHMIAKIKTKSVLMFGGYYEDAAHKKIWKRVEKKKIKHKQTLFLLR